MIESEYNSPRHFRVAGKPMLGTVTSDLIDKCRSKILCGVVPEGYPLRGALDESRAMWHTDYPGYAPHFVSSPKNMKPWPQTPEDIRPEDRDFFERLGCTFDEKGWPLLPFGRTGYAGPGRMPGIGFSRAVDTFMTRHHPTNGDLQFVSMIRSDLKVAAIPGGKLDPVVGPDNTLLGYEDIDDGTIRELTEETIDLTADSDGFRSELADMRKRLLPIFDGWVVNMGPRSTDNASFTTYAQRVHLTQAEARKIILKNAPGETESVEWLNASEENLRRLFAMQSAFGLMAIAQLHDAGLAGDIDEQLRDSALRVQDSYNA